MPLTRHVNVADAIDAQDIPAFHQIADAILPVSSAQFLVLAATADLANERVFTPGAGLVATDGGAGGLYTLNVATADATIVVNADSIQVGVIQNANIRNAAATSVIGRSVNSIGTVADIAASADLQFLRRSGGVLGFGAIVQGDLPALDPQFLTLATSSLLTNERVFTPSSGLTPVDGGAGGAYTLTNDVLTGKAGGQTWLGGTVSGNPLTIKANTSNNGTLALTATTVTTSGAIQVAGTIRGDIGDGNNTIQLLDGADRNVFRGIQFPAWTDSLSAMWFQVGAVGGSTMFTTLTAAPFNRLAFLATTTQFSAGSYSTTPVPTGIFDVLNASQSLKLSIASGGGVTLSSLGGAGTILVKADNAGLLGAASATTDYTAIITLTAGAGMTGGGDTSTNRTFNVATADATIVVNADSIQAGVMQTANIANDAITYAKIQNVTASRLLGRDSSGGDVQEITLGTNLSLTGTTLNAASTGAPTGAQYLTLATDAGLSAERVLVMSTGFTTSDGGANGNYTVTNDVFTGQSGSPTWQGSTSAGSLSIRANTAVTGTINLRATQVSMFLAGSEYFIATAGAFAIGSSYLAINQASPLSTAYLDADVTGSRENVRFKVAGTTISDNGGRAYFQVFPRSGVTVGSGVTDASQIWTTMYLESTTFTAASGSPVTFAATTFYIANAPVAAGGLVITNPFAMWVDDGRSRFDGDGSGYVFELPSLSSLPAGTINEPDRYLQVWITGVGRRFASLFSVT